MPRIRQNAEQYAVADFQKELRIRRAEYELQSIQSLSDVTGIPLTSLWKNLKEPLTLRVSVLEAIVKAVHPDARIVLALLGYTTKEINGGLKNG